MQASHFELELLCSGRTLILGLDEAGRGALAGPVVAGAVLLDYQALPAGLNDSKQLTREERERLAGEIRDSAIACATALCDAREIETINILQASLKAMARAHKKTGHWPDAVLVDGLHCPHIPCGKRAAPQLRAVVDGDALVACIAAASILAKVERDRIMRACHRRHRCYGFDTNVGYGTPKHLAALREHGICALHRRTFRPVREVLEPQLLLGFEVDGFSSDYTPAAEA
jgi:ribonuclease HII